MSFISYAQNLEDVLLYRALKHVERGFYIDVGAQEPVKDSVTRAFYERGWRGINIEPVRTYFGKLVQDRPEDVNLMVAASDCDGHIPFCEVVGTGLSTTVMAVAERQIRAGWEVRGYQVPCLPLAEICKAHGVKEVHFLKVDVEGAERAVLAGFDFDAVRPWIVLVEDIEPLSRSHSFHSWEPLLLSQGYHFVYFDGINRFYVAKERRELEKAFSSPPNVYDEFVRYSEWEAQQRVVEASKEIERLTMLTAKNEALQAETAALKTALSAMQSEKESLRAEKEALNRQVEELSRWLQAVYASTSWRIAAPLRHSKTALVRVAKAIRSQLTEAACQALYLVQRPLVKLVRWAARYPRLRSLGKRLLSKSPALRARVRRLIAKETLMESSASPGPQSLPKVEETELPESVRAVLEELRAAIGQNVQRHPQL